MPRVAIPRRRCSPTLAAQWNLLPSSLRPSSTAAKRDATADFRSGSDLNALGSRPQRRVQWPILALLTVTLPSCLLNFQFLARLGEAERRVSGDRLSVEIVDPLRHKKALLFANQAVLKPPSARCRIPCCW